MDDDPPTAALPPGPPPTVPPVPPAADGGPASEAPTATMRASWRHPAWWRERRGRLRRWQWALVAGAAVVALGAIVASLGDDPTPLDVVGEMRREVGDEADGAPADPSVDPSRALPPPSPWADEDPAELEVVEAPRPDVDYTDREAVARLAGSWEFESGGVAEFGAEVAEEVDHGGARIALYPVSARGLPSRYTVVRVPGGGNFLAFWRDGYEVVWENVVFHDRDLLSYAPLDGDRRRYAYRAGTRRFRRGAPPPFAGGEAPPVPPAVADAPAAAADLPALWRRAEALRRGDRYHSLAATLDEILAADPGDRRAREWRAEVREAIREQERELAGDLRDALQDLADAVGDEDLRQVLRLWSGNGDAATRAYFDRLFERRGEPRVGIELLSTEVEDGVVHFTADVSFVYPRDRRLAENHRWRATFHGGRFSGAFPG